MKLIKQMNQGELAAFIDSHLRIHNINVVLSGGASVSIYSNFLYVSKDLDFIGIYTLDHKKIESVMSEIGFSRRGKYYTHPQTEYYVEFISGPPTIGQNQVVEIIELQMETGIVRIISPTDSVMDRLAAYYYWKDLQAFEQAILVAKNNAIDLEIIAEWSKMEGKEKEYQKFMKRVNNEI
jgi:hypothetical protein